MIIACNREAFTPAERIHYAQLSDQLMPAVISIQEREDGYTLRIDTALMPASAVAAWADLERRCCPFFDIQMDLNGAGPVMELSLTGGEGVKQFIRMEFVRLHDKMPK